MREKRAYESPRMQVTAVSLGEFCAGTCANSSASGTWDDTIRNINEAGYRTLRTIDKTYTADYVTLSN